MEFRNLFIEYKIEIKKLDKTCKRVPWKKLPWQNKFLSILILVITIAWVTFYLLNKEQIANWMLVLLLLVVVRLHMEETNSMLKFRLNKINKKYSKKRTKKVIKLLKKYKININNIDSINFLIEEAEKQKRKANCFQDGKKILKTIGAIIVAIGLFGQKELYERFFNKLTIKNKIYFAGIIIMIVLLGYVLFPLIKYILYPDYYMYDKFIEDLRQVILFYSSNQENI